MPRVYDVSFKMTPEKKKKFKIWLFMNDLTIRKFASNCGVSRQYISQVIDGEINITPTVIETFKKGGYIIKE